MEDQPEFPIATTTSTAFQQPHIAVCPGVGMGHLAPFLSLATTLSSAPYHSTVTLVIIVPLLTAAESHEISSFFSSHPHIRRLDFHVNPATPDATADPFFFRYDAITRSAHQLTRRLSTLSPPISAAFSDFMFTAGLNNTLPELPDPFPHYTVITTSARFFSLISYLPHLVKSLPDHEPGQPAEIPGHDPVPSENIPPPFFSPDHIFTDLIVTNARALPLSNGIILNTFESFESVALSALKTGTAQPHLPPIYPVGPLHTIKNDEDEVLLSWLDEQPGKSVIYVSFGNRTAMARDQIRELGAGLVRTRYKFLWVVKTSMVDKEDKEELRSLLGEELYEKLCKKGKVVKQWVSQKAILGHEAVGGFVSHCGWNSVVEAVRCGVPILAWPQHGDQRENAEVVEKAGLGVWERGWGWGVGGGRVVEAAEIAQKVEMVMGSEGLRERARWVEEEATRACEVGGSSRAALMSIIGSLEMLL